MRHGEISLVRVLPPAQPFTTELSLLHPSSIPPPSLVAISSSSYLLNSILSCNVMASARIVDPQVLLRVAPLVTATGTLWFAVDQDFFLSLFLHKDHRPTSDRILPSYFRLFFRRGLLRVLGLLTLTLSTAGVNLSLDRAGLVRHRSLAWYTAGTLCAASHLLFVPAVAPRVVAVCGEPDSGKASEHLEGWLWVHRIRTYTVDVAAWVCFLVAAGRSLSV